MMGLVFSSQPIDEIIETISGGVSAGEFAGKPIPVRDYAIYENQCQAWIKENKLGGHKFFLEQCINVRLRQVYVLAKIGERMGLSVSPETIKREVIEEAKREYDLQTALDPEDRLSINDIYRYSLSRFPMDIRTRTRTTGAAHGALKSPFLSYPNQDNINHAATKTSLQLRLVYYQSQELQKRLKKNIEVKEEEITQLFSQEQEEKKKKIEDLRKKGESTAVNNNQAKLASLNLKPSPVQRKRLSERLKDSKAKKQLTLLEKKLVEMAKNQKAKYNLKTFSTELQTSITDLGTVRLDKLSQIKIASNVTFNLMQADFFSQLAVKNPQDRIVGPLKSGPYTLYVQVSQINYAGIPKPKNIAKKTTKKNTKAKINTKPDNNLSNELMSYLIEEESRRGNFKLQKIRQP